MPNTIVKQASQSQQQSPVRRSATRTANQRKCLISLILSLLAPVQIRNLRKRYALGQETIAELSKLSQCPPVLLYSVLTPIKSQTPLKLRLLRVEKQVVLLQNEGWSNQQIAEKLNIPLASVREHTDACFQPEMYLARPWYHEKAPKPEDPNALIYDEATLPPTSRLGWTDNALTDIPEERKGRCPICGYLCSLPCHACRVKHDMMLRTIPKVTDFDPADEEDEVEEDLMFV